MQHFKPNYDEGMWKGAPASSFLKAKELRKNETKAERLLWERLKNNQLRGLKFRRQHPVSLFIADFYCHKLKLIIEIDGEYHLTDEQKQKDTERTKILSSNGLTVIRFSNNEVLNRIESVLQSIREKTIEIENPNYPQP